MAAETKTDQFKGENEVWTTSPTQCLKIRMQDEGYASIPPMTVMAAFRERVRTSGDQPALSQERGGKWVSWTWKQYYDQVIQCGKSMIALGCTERSGVGIQGFNCPEWFFACLGAVSANLIAAGIYTTNSPDATAYVIKHCDAEVVFVEDAKQLKKVLDTRDQCPKLKHIVCWGEKVDDPAVMSFEEFLEKGKDVPSADIEARIQAQQPGMCATLIYTSGTTGTPKGAMVSHDNLIWCATVGNIMIPESKEPPRSVSYLPLSHIAAQMLDMFLPMAPGKSAIAGANVHFARPDALKGSIVQTLKAVRPTSFLGVPRVWEKIMEGMKAKGAEVTGVKKSLGAWAKGIGLEGSYAQQKGAAKPWGHWLASFLVLDKVKAALGLDACAIEVTGAAPISKDVLEYFMSLDIPIMEAYGMSESTGLITVSTPDGRFRTGSCGKAVVGIDIVLKNQDAEGNGEITFKGRNVFMGYLHNREATAETFDENGYLCSGDIGRLDDEGFLWITGRIKELLITAGGENVAPTPIEDEIKVNAPIVSNAMLIGDKRKFLSVLLTLKTEMAEDGSPMSDLSGPCKAALKEVGSNATTVEEAMKDEKVTEYLNNALKKTNEKAVSNAQKVQKFVILPADFSIPTGELTGTMKLKRKVVYKKYEAEIDGIYN